MYVFFHIHTHNNNWSQMVWSTTLPIIIIVIHSYTTKNKNNRRWWHVCEWWQRGRQYRHHSTNSSKYEWTWDEYSWTFWQRNLKSVSTFMGWTVPTMMVGYHLYAIDVQLPTTTTTTTSRWIDNIIIWQQQNQANVIFGLKAKVAFTWDQMYARSSSER